MKFELSVADIPDYPDWKRGFIWGLVAGIIFALIPWVFPEALLSEKFLKAKNLPFWFNQFGASILIFISSFIICGIIGAFRPQYRK